MLVTAFGWKQPVEALVLAEQLAAIGAGAEGMDPSVGQLKHTVLRAQELYLLLDEAKAREADDAFNAVYERLAEAPWIWTGKCFTRPRCIAYSAVPELEPLLFTTPAETVVSRAFLEKFGIKEAFSFADYLEAVARLPRNVPLSEQHVRACERVFTLLGKHLDTLQATASRLPPQQRVLLNASNRLEAAGHLTYDDMVWNESQNIRQGCTFVSKSVQRDVAVALGATSLHAKHAEQSARSTKIACPSVASLQSILPSSFREWCSTFLSEILLATERRGGTDVDVFVDYRQHPSERVIQPSMQSLQHTALCIHVHGLVLSAGDVSALFGGESSRAGFLTGFFVSDCLQILSGNGFYVLDPTGAYLSSSSSSTAAGGRAAGPAGRRYDVLEHDFVAYPDQLLPFCNLPLSPGDITRGTQSTLLRFPWRTAPSTLSSFVMNDAKALLTAIERQITSALVFTESVHHVSAWSVGKASEYDRWCHADARLAVPVDTLKRRNATRMSTEWKKKSLLHSFFKTPAVLESQVEFEIALEINNKHHRDVWLLCDNIGAGRSRELAGSPVHEVLNSTPYVSVACHLYRDSNPAPLLHGRLFKIVDTGQRTGLPVHINGCFKKAMRETRLLVTSPFTVGSGFSSSTVNGSEAQVKATWNRTLLEDCVVDAYMKLLLAAKRKLGAMHPKALYRVWPRLAKVRADARLCRVCGLLRRVRRLFSLLACRCCGCERSNRIRMSWARWFKTECTRVSFPTSSSCALTETTVHSALALSSTLQGWTSRSVRSLKLVL